MQVSNKLKKVSESGSILHVVIGILVFGSVWGLVEATLGGALHFVHFLLPIKGAIPGAIGMAIMTTFVVMYRRPKLTFLLAVIAALFKPLSAVIYHEPIFGPSVVNPASAILLEGLALTLVIGLLSKRFESSIKMRIGAGVAAGYLSATSYAILASSLGMGGWAFMGVTERITTALANGTALAVIGTCLLLLGYIVGINLKPKFWQFSDLKPKAFYASTIAITALCSIGAVAFA
jgi:hypothetical protein